MNMKTTVPLAVAVVLGLVAAIVASQLVKQRPVTVAGTNNTVSNLAEVVVAARDIAPGTALTGEDLKTLRIEAASAPVNVQSNPSVLFNRVAKIQIPAGQMVHEGFLAEHGVKGGLPGVIPEGFRAMTVEINEFTGLAGMLEPGNRIDVIARFDEPNGGGQMSRTIVQNVPIIAVGTSLTNRKSTGEDDAAKAAAPVIEGAPQSTKAFARSITLLVTPQDAEKIDLASSTNAARLTLRASADNETARVAGATASSILGAAPKTARQPETSTPVVASSQKSAADDAFGPSTPAPTFRPVKSTPGTRTITVIRGGIPTEIEVEVSNLETADTSDLPSSSLFDVFVPATK